MSRGEGETWRTLAPVLATRELDEEAALAGRVHSPGGEGEELQRGGGMEDVNGGGLEKTRTYVLPIE
jgi:hypothetical protein